MSRAGTKSSQGDDYQRVIALHWIIRLIKDDDEIDYIQAESNGLPGVDEQISVDDVVVVYTNGRRRHIQAKKNQPQNRAWSLSDQSLADELPKIRSQLESNENTVVALYSRTPFGDIQSLAEASREYPDLASFKRQSGQILQAALTAIAAKWERTEAESFHFLRRLEFGAHHSFDDWDRQNKWDLKQLVTHAELALPVLESFLNAHQSKIQAATLTIRRNDVIQHLAHKGLVQAPMISEVVILNQFEQASCIGRQWQRTVGGHRIERVELEKLIQLIEGGADTVLVTDRPGSGKTCLLLDLADRIEQDSRFGLLFIKGDHFARLRNEGDLKSAGMPEDIVGLCGRLSEHRRVVVIIDSLDVLSMNREHGALGMFLRLIDRLNPMRNVTVVAACRTFDLQYDQQLRDRKWNYKIYIADFDYDAVVAPLLKEWGVQETQVDAELRRLLLLPQNLRLFEAIVSRGGRCDIHTAYELQEVYLQEVVIKDPALGQPAIAALQALASRLLRDRTNLIHPAAFSGGESIRRSLVSNGVLYEEQNGNFGFSHQSLFDNLAVYSSIERGEDLATFIKAHPPFPFLRAAVRTFVFHLRTHAPNQFSRQIWAALHDTEIAYHFRRLIAESLAEISPENDDWLLLQRLFRQEPELFRRLFWRIGGDAWFQMLLVHWLPSLASPPLDCEWYKLFVRQFERWMNSHPCEVVSLWRRAFSEGWDKASDLASVITFQLHKYQHWDIDGVSELIETLFVENKAERDFLGSVISRYADATNRGDELLWRYIIKDVDLRDTQPYDVGKKLHCEPHVFHDKEFLINRMLQSEWLLDATTNALEEWATSDNTISASYPRMTFLHSSSWEYSHCQHDMHPADSLMMLLAAVEHALKHHARKNDEWWRRREPELRSSQEEVLLYFLTQAYKENPEANIDGMSALLTNEKLLRYGHIENELGELIRTGYHLLTPEIQETNQKAILVLYTEKDWGADGMPIWAYHPIYNYLIWIPAIFRLPLSQNFIERFQPHFGPYIPRARIYSRGGWVGSPVPLENFMKLNDCDLLRLFHYYNDYSDHSSHPADFNKGGRDMVERTLTEAASRIPMRFLTLLPKIEWENLQAGYITSLLSGAADHLRYRFGRLRPPQDWQATEPLPDGAVLAGSLLDLIESKPYLLQDGHAAVRMLEACCEVLEDSDSVRRLVPQLFRLSKHPDPEGERQRIFSQNKKGITADDLRSDAINSIRGIAASSAIMLYNRLLEKEIDPPEILFSLMSLFACDPVGAVRAALLDYISYLTARRHALGWQLFHKIFREPQIHLWPLAERHLYYQYHEHFSEVAPYLERIRLEAPVEAGEAWGRIATLSSLSGHIEQDVLFCQLESMNLAMAWLGAAQVFAANLDQHINACVNGLKRILKWDKLDMKIYGPIEHAFAPKSQGRHLDRDFALNFIDAINLSNLSLHSFLDWLADLAGRDPDSAVDICEHLFTKLSEADPHHRIWHTEPLIAALSSILREADETDNKELIRRAVLLQDQFLRMDIPGMDEYLKWASQL